MPDLGYGATTCDCLLDIYMKYWDPDALRMDIILENGLSYLIQEEYKTSASILNESCALPFY
jgi:hypothetical protein